MPKDFEIEQMMAKGSAKRTTEFTREDKSLVDKMVTGSVQTLDANLSQKMIDGSIETNNARIVDSMLAGSSQKNKLDEDKKEIDDDKPSLLTQLKRTISSGVMAKDDRK